MSIADDLAGKMGPPPTDEMAQGNDMGLEAAADDLIKAIHARDASMVVEALRNAFTILDSEPHEEGDHTGEEEAGPE